MPRGMVKYIEPETGSWVLLGENDACHLGFRHEYLGLLSVVGQKLAERDELLALVNEAVKLVGAGPAADPVRARQFLRRVADRPYTGRIVGFSEPPVQEVGERGAAGPVTPGGSRSP